LKFRVWDIFNRRFDNSRFAFTSDGTLLRQVDIVCWETVSRDEFEVDLGLVINGVVIAFENDILCFDNEGGKLEKLVFNGGLWMLQELYINRRINLANNSIRLLPTNNFNFKVISNHREYEKDEILYLN
jgi:hypothetical protein